jgi:hypothetical protein
MPPSITAIFRDKNSRNKVATLIENSGQSIDDIKLPHQFFESQMTRDDKFAYLWTDIHVGNYMNNYYDPATGENLFVHIPEVAYEFYISLMAPKNSPFIEKFNEILLRFVETGIGSYHMSKAYTDNDMVWIRRMIANEVPKEQDKAIKLNEMKMAFEVYIYLCIGSIIIFLLEVIIHRN